MTETTTMNVNKEDAPRFTRLQLSHAAQGGERVSMQEYLSHAASLLEHLEECAFCMESVKKHIKAKAKKKEG